MLCYARNNTIYIAGLPKHTSDEEVAEFFGSIGTLKKSKKTFNMGEPVVHLYKDKRTGQRIA